MKLKIIFFFGIIVSSFGKLTGQYTNLNFFSLDRKDGMADNRVRSIIKDSHGYMWFGTDNGLSRYNGYEFTNFYQTDDSTGLPGNKISSLFLSSDKQLWIGLEQNGISSYNPQEQNFTNYDFTGQGESLAANFIIGILEDTDSVMYVASKEAIYYKEFEKDEFLSLPFSEKDFTGKDFSSDGLLKHEIVSIAKDEKKGIWIFYNNWLFSHYDHINKKFRHFSLQDQNKNYQQSLVSSFLHYDDKLWIGSIGTEFIVHDLENNITRKVIRDEYISGIKHISLTKDSMFLISADNGLTSFNPSTYKHYRFTNIRENNRSLSSTPCSYSFEDDNKVLWVASGETGINYAFPGYQFRHMYSGDTYYTLGNEDVTAILHDSKGNLWTGYKNGEIELHNLKEHKKFKIETQTLVNSPGPGTIFDIKEDSSGNIYSSSWTGGVQVFDPEKKVFTPLTGTRESYLQIFDGVDVRDIEFDGLGNIWLAIHGKGVYQFNPLSGNVKKFTSELPENESLTNNWVYDLCFDGEDNLWVCSAYGLSKILPDRKTVKKYVKSEGKYGLGENITHFAVLDREGNIWIGSPAYLHVYKPQKDEFFKFSAGNRDKLFQFRGLMHEGSNYYWASTTNGILKLRLTKDPVDPKLIELNHYDTNDGLQSDQFHLSAVEDDNNGQMYFGSNKGVDYFHPENIDSHEIEPHLRVENVRIFGKDIYDPYLKLNANNRIDELHLKHYENTIALEYVALNYFSNKNNEYSYLLEPLNSEWVNVDESREIHFTHLDPGNYSLSLRVKTTQGNINTAHNILSFYIQPPFWKTLTFRVIVLVLIIAGIFLILEYNTRQLKEKQVRLEEIVSQRTKELKLKNYELKSHSANLSSVNDLLQQRQEKIQSQSEELQDKSEILTRANKELNALNSMKDRFFSIISHDLRGPFNALMGFSEILKEEYENIDEERRKELIGHIYHSAEGTQNLLDNLLHWSRSQTQQINMSLQFIDTEAMCSDLQHLFNPMLQKKGISMAFDIDDSVEIFADRELLNVILRNLISNAIKFTPKGGKVYLKISRLQDSKAIIEVVDNGVGMDEETIENLFTMNSNNSIRGTEGEKGTGLGLVLSKDFAEKMKGSLEVESRKFQGTVFRLILPASS